MKKEGNFLEKDIEEISKKFIEKIKNEEIYIISHFDTDGITSATLMIKTLEKLDKKFILKIVKSLDENFINSLPKDKIIIFLDIASGSLNYIEKGNFKEVFIIDHHEIENIPEGINIINPEIYENPTKISSSCLTYLFCKQINAKIKDFAKLAVIGMIGDSMEKEINNLNSSILEDGEIKRKKGVLIYPSTRPVNKVLEFSSNPYIPEITGNISGVLKMLREIGLSQNNGKYKSIIELNEDEMKNFVTAILLRDSKIKDKDLIGDIFLLKFFNKLEDARELSAVINACSKLGESETAIQFCMEIQKSRKKAESIYIKYKQTLISGLKFVSEVEKIKGKNFVIINARDNIQDTVIGTIASIVSRSSIYEEGTIITTMAYYGDKIKVSARIVGRTGRNVRMILARVIESLGGEVSGHEFTAGCIITKEKEEEFINLLKKNLEVEMIKV